MARTFNGNTANRLRVGSAVITTTPFTFAAWCRPTSVAADSAIICIADETDAGNSNGHHLRLNTSGNVVALTATGGGAGQAVSSTAAGTGSFVHVCGVWASAASRSAYLNGGGKTTDTTNTTPTGTLDMTSVGVAYGGGTFSAPFTGDIAEVAIWSAALQDAEIASLAKGVSPLLIRPQSLAAYYPILGNDSPEPDRWRDKYDLTLNGTPAKADPPRVYYPSYGKVIGTSPLIVSTNYLVKYRRTRVPDPTIGI